MTLPLSTHIQNDWTRFGTQECRFRASEVDSDGSLIALAVFIPFVALTPAPQYYARLSDAFGVVVECDQRGVIFEVQLACKPNKKTIRDEPVDAELKPFDVDDAELTFGMIRQIDSFCLEAMRLMFDDPNFQWEG